MIRIIVLFLLALPSFAQAQYLDGLPQAKLPLQSTTIMPVCQGGTLGRPGTCTTAQTTIASFSLASQGIINVLSAGALCNGTANDTSAIQATITGAANVAAVYVPPGVTCMVGTLSIPSYTDLIIDGTLELIAATNASMLFAPSGATQIVVEGSGTLNGNASAQTGGFSGGFSNVGGLSYFWWRGLTSTNFQNTPFGPTNTAHSWVSQAVFTNSGDSVGYSINSSDCWADHITISGINDEGYAFYGGVHNCGISNSTVTGSKSGAAGISVLNDAGQPAASHDLIIANNQLYGNSSSGVSIATGIGGTLPNYAIIVTGNRSLGNNQGNIPGAGGITAENAYDILISGNQISNDGNGTSGAAGIVLSTAVSQVQIIGNTIWDEGQGSTLGVGISLNNNSNVLASANTMFDDQSTKTMAFGFNGPVGASTQLLNNIIFGTIGAAYDITSASDTVVAYGVNTSPPSYSFNESVNVAGAVNSFGSVNAIGIGGSGTGVAPTITAFGGDANISVDILPKGTGGLNVSGPINVVGAANNLGIGGSGAGIPLALTAFGSDTNISVDIFPKGTGGLNVSGPINVVGAANNLGIGGSSAGIPLALTAFGSDTNISIDIFPKGTGGLNVSGPINVVGAANNLGIGGGGTGVAPTITAFGSDTNISLGFFTKGTGVLVINGQTAVSCAANTVSLTTLTITAGLVTHC